MIVKNDETGEIISQNVDKYTCRFSHKHSFVYLQFHLSHSSICSGQTENQYNSRMVLRKVRILTLLHKVRILTLRITILELLMCKVWNRDKVRISFMGTRRRFIEPGKYSI